MSLCSCVHPFDTPHDETATSSCKNGIVQSGGCATSIVYPVPSAGTSTFYTSWSWFYIMICLGLGVVYAILNILGRSSKFPNLQKLTTNVAYQIVLLSILAMGVVNSMGVFSTSQLLLAKNFKLVNTDPKSHGKVPDNLAISTSFFHNAMNINLDAHQVPAILAVLLLALLSSCRTKQTWWKGSTTSYHRTWKANLGLFGGIVLCQLLLVGIWMAVPVEDKETHKTYQWVKKINYVYANPPGYFFAIQACLVLVLALAISFKMS